MWHLIKWYLPRNIYTILNEISTNQQKLEEEFIYQEPFEWFAFEFFTELLPFGNVSKVSKSFDQRFVKFAQTEIWKKNLKSNLSITDSFSS